VGCAVLLVELVPLTEGMDPMDPAVGFVPELPVPLDVPVEVLWLNAGMSMVAANAAAIARIRH